MKVNKKWIVGATSAALVASAIVPVASAASFSDIENSDHKDAILALAEAGIISGYTDGTFKPNAIVTRGNVAKLLGKWLVSEGYEIPADYNTVERFTDLPVNSADQELVQYAALVKDAGVFKGSNNKLMQTNNMSREQMAVVLVRALKTVYGVDLVADYKADNFESKITDLEKATADENREAIIALEYAELTTVTAFNPKNSLTRGQFASFLNRAITNVAKEEVKVESVTAVNGTVTVKLAEAAKEVSVEDFTVSQAINGGTATEVTPSAVVLSEDGLTATLTVDQVAAQETTEQSVVYTVNEVAAPAFVVEATTLAVSSVDAINGKTVEVKFTKPVKKSTVVNGSDKLLNVSFTSLETPAKTITSADAAAVLSEDGKTLTITAPTTEVFEGRYQVKVENVETTKSEKITKFDQIIDLGKDTTAPAIASVEKVNASTSKVTFTEAIANLSTGTAVTYSYKLADGTVVPTADVTVTPAVDGKSITVSASAAKYAGKTITATMLGGKDHAGNLINPNPSTFSFQIGDKDGVAPTVASTKAISPTQIEVVFSEEVQGFTTADITVTGDSASIETVTATKVEQDKTDKKKYIVTLNQSALKSGVNSAVADLKISKTNITDLSGEAMAADYTAIVTIKKDTVAPKHVATKIVEEAGVQWLVLEFDEELHATVGTAVAPVAGSATSFKDFVTVSGKDITLGSSATLTDDKKGVKVKLTDVQFDSKALTDGTKYTFDVKATDAANVTSDTIKVEFTYNDKADSNEPKLVSTGAITGTGQDTIVVKFDRELDGASATNVANYSIAGVTVKNAVLSPKASDGTQEVTLTLDKNEQSGERAITISGVKSKAGVAMQTFNGTVTLKENVKPTVVTAKVTSTKTIELTFSENVTLTSANFDVFIGDSTTAVTGVSTAAGATADKAVITLTNALSEADLGKTITIKPATGINVKDLEGNVLDFKEILVTKQ